MHQYFLQHPCLLPASIKEVHFFDGGLDPNWDKYAEGETLYRSYFPLRSRVNRKNALCFEASPDYIFNPVAAERMAQIIPNAKIVVLLRDPVERAISHYFHERRRGRETECIEIAFARENERLAVPMEQRAYKDTVFINQSYKLRGRYAEQLELLYRHFPVENVLVIESEAFFEEPMTSLEQVLAFVGMESFPVTIDVKPTGKGANRTEVPNSIRDHLSDYFSEPNEALADLLGRRFRWM